MNISRRDNAMILKKVELHNFISHKDSQIDLDYGINVITGPNGAGKTSVLDGISFALFNVHSRGKKENLINSRANNSKLIVQFNESGIDYQTEWSMERNRVPYGTLFRMHNSEKALLARGGERVIVSEVEKILGIDKDLFLQSIYVRQGEIEKLVTATPAVRKELISKLLGIEDLQRSWANLKDVIGEYEIVVATLDGELKKIPEIKKEIQEDEAELNKLESSARLKKTELKEIEAKIEVLQSMVKKLDADRRKFDQLESRKKVLEKEIDNIEARLRDKKAELDVSIEAYVKVRALEDNIKKLLFLENYVQGLTQKEKKESERNQLRCTLERLEELSKILQDNKKDYDLYNEKSTLLQKRREERKSYEGAHDTLRRTRKQLQDNEEEQIQRSEDLIRELESCCAILEEQVDIESMELVILRKRGELQIIKAESEKKAEEDISEIGAIRTKIEDLEYKLTRISEAEVCPICGRELTPDHIEKLKGEFAAEKKRIEKEIVSLREEQEKANQDKRKAESKLEKMTSIHPRETKRLAEQIAGIKAKIAQQSLEVKELEEKAWMLEKLDEEIKKIEGETRQLNEAYQNYESTKRELTRYPSKEQIDMKLKPITTELEETSLSLKALVDNLGYEPKNPEKELQEMRKKKEEYDRNDPVARRKPQLESDVSSLGKELSSKKSEQSTVIKDISKLGYDETVHRDKEEELEGEKGKKSKVDKDIVETETTINRLSDQASKLRKELEQLTEKEKEKKRIEVFIRILNAIREAFGKDGIQRLIRARARPMLEKMTRDFFERFNLEYSDIKIDDDYNIAVIGPSGSQDIDQISGGERVALAVALRLAIARVLSGRVETVIMDEPTTHLDEERRKELTNILNSFFKESGKIIPQMLIITHHHEIEDAADVIYAVGKKEGYSVVEARS